MSTTPVYLIGDAAKVLRTLPEQSVNTCVTSPPYWGLRDFGVDGQLGVEDHYQEYVEELVNILREVRRVLQKDGTLWLNLGDTYSAGKSKESFEGHDLGWSKRSSTKRAQDLPPKNLVGIPWRVAFALQQDGWYLRQDIIWSKSNPMPESVKDRCTKSHEYIFLLSKSSSYYYDAEAIAETAVHTTPRKTPAIFGGKNKHEGYGTRLHSGKQWNPDGPVNRNKRSVWTVATQSYTGSHFAVFPEKLIEPCILAGAPEGGMVLDPFAGSGTTLAVSRRLGRRSIGIDLNPEYRELAAKRCGLDIPDITEWKKEAQE